MVICGDPHAVCLPSQHYFLTIFANVATVFISSWFFGRTDVQSVVDLGMKHSIVIFQLRRLGCGGGVSVLSLFQYPRALLWTRCRKV